MTQPERKNAYSVTTRFAGHFSLIHGHTFTHALHQMIANATLYAEQAVKEHNHNAAAGAAYMGSYLSDLAVDIRVLVLDEMEANPEDELVIKTRSVQALLRDQLKHLINITRQIADENDDQHIYSNVPYWYADTLLPVITLPAVERLNDLLNETATTDIDQIEAIYQSVGTLENFLSTRQRCPNPDEVYRTPDGGETHRRELKQKAEHDADEITRISQLMDSHLLKRDD